MEFSSGVSAQGATHEVALGLKATVMNGARFLQAHGYLTVFFGLLLEYLGLPVPGELFLVFFGAVVYWGKLNFWIVLSTGFAAVLLGDHFWYFAARRGGKKWLRWFCRATLGSAQCELRTERFFSALRARVPFVREVSAGRSNLRDAHGWNDGDPLRTFPSLRISGKHALASGNYRVGKVNGNTA